MRYYCQTMNCSANNEQSVEVCQECGEENAGPFPHSTLPELKAQKPVDQSLDAKVDELRLTRDSAEIFKAGASYQAPISEAIGEAKAWRAAIARLECAQGLNGRDVLNLKQEARHRGVKL